MGRGGGVRGARVSDFLGGGGGRKGVGARVSEFLNKESKSKNFFFFGGGGGERLGVRGLGGGGRWMDRRIGPSPFAPSTFEIGGISMH